MGRFRFAKKLAATVAALAILLAVPAFAAPSFNVFAEDEVKQTESAKPAETTKAKANETVKETKKASAKASETTKHTEATKTSETTKHTEASKPAETTKAT